MLDRDLVRGWQFRPSRESIEGAICPGGSCCNVNRKRDRENDPRAYKQRFMGARIYLWLLHADIECQPSVALYPAQVLV